MLPKSLIYILLSLMLSGCAGMNAFHTPETLEPGKVTVGMGTGFGVYSDDKQDVEQAFSHAMSWGRIGIFPKLDIGVKTSFTDFLGADLKYEFLSGTVNMSVAAGYGRGKNDIIGGGMRKMNAAFISLSAGYQDTYVSLKLSDYYYSTKNGNSVYSIDRLIPGIAIGYYATSVETRLRPVIELSSYFIPQVITVGNLGFQFNF